MRPIAATHFSQRICMDPQTKFVKIGVLAGLRRILQSQEAADPNSSRPRRNSGSANNSPAALYLCSRALWHYCTHARISCIG